MAVANGSGQGLLRLCGRSRGVALIEAGSVATVGSRRAGIRADARCWPVLPSAGRAVFRAWNRCWRASGQPSRCQDPDMARVHGCAWRVRRTVRRQPRKRLERTADLQTPARRPVAALRVGVGRARRADSAVSSARLSDGPRARRFRRRRRPQRLLKASYAPCSRDNNSRARRTSRCTSCSTTTPT